MRHQIRTLNVPRWGTGAFVVVPAANSTAAFNGQNIVTGAPGTVLVPSPRPAALNDGELGGPYNQPSSVAPDFILPSIYVARVNRSMKFPGDTNITNVTPIPATAIGTIVRNGWTKPVIGGNRVTANPRSFTRWPTYSGRETA